MLRWIFALLGASFFNFPGGIVGFLVGYYLDNLSVTVQTNTGAWNSKSAKQNVSPADFELNLLSLASIVIKADGQISQNELDFVRMHFVQVYGKDRANAIFRTFNEVVKKREVNAERICSYLRSRTLYEARLQIVHFLFNVANADGLVSESEVIKIREIAGYLGLRLTDFESLKAMFFKNPDSAYTILGLDRSASESEIKAAYRNSVKKYHPDRLQHLDEAHRKGAEEKFRKVQEAYEQIKKERGF